ncbi:hypothetical protein [Streptomyces sp. NBC_01275]|uniref:hypothetical protein n=1 Tax=Streptomyces sp. NBC_01275 TaxID=2903807 RepID=UPI002B1DBEFB|nr:hypothetical protein [Streptomyces sp. NBC_01275]
MTEQFGESHEGVAGAVLADGGEPKPVYVDFGSGAGSGLETSEWWAYDGRSSRPLAAAYRGACACGWRGEAHPIDWEELADEHQYDLDTGAAHREWSEHIRAVERRTVPLPDELTHLMDRLEDQLTALTEQAPVAALKAATTLERLTADIAQEAAYAIQEDELSWETIGTALGLSPAKARSLLTHYLLRP